MTRAEMIERLRQIAARLDEIDRQLLNLCPYLDRATQLNNERIRLAREAGSLHQNDPRN